MMSPCKGCLNAGCGSYHDECPLYQEYAEVRRTVYKNRLRRLKISEEKIDRIVKKRKTPKK